MKFDRERGQILVQVAIMVGVLFAFVALAVDAGNVYGGRRRMQNAADAGALAGARAICFPGDGADPEAAAYDYAEQNGARRDDVQVTIEDYTVIVTAAQTLDTFFAGVIGINEADVRAEAAAACGGTVSGRGLWPLAFKSSVYTNTERIPCNEDFLVFSSGSEAGPGPLECAPDFCYDEDGNEKTESELILEEHQYEDCEGKYNCEGMGFHFATDERGWLQLPDTGEDYPCKNYNCGADSVACYLEFDYPGLIEVGNCVPGKSGVAAAMKAPVDARKDDIVQIILWDDTPCEPEGVLASCSGDPPYYIRDFGCVQVIQWEQKYVLSAWGKGPDKNLKAIEATKICSNTMGTVSADPNDPDRRIATIDMVDGTVNLYDEFCSSPTGSTTGVPPEEWETRSVSLIQWPRP